MVLGMFLRENASVALWKLDWLALDRLPVLSNRRKNKIPTASWTTVTEQNNKQHHKYVFKISKHRGWNVWWNKPLLLAFRENCGLCQQTCLFLGWISVFKRNYLSPDNFQPSASLLQWPLQLAFTQFLIWKNGTARPCKWFGSCEMTLCPLKLCFRRKCNLEANDSSGIAFVAVAENSEHRFSRWSWCL